MADRIQTALEKARARRAALARAQANVQAAPAHSAGAVPAHTAQSTTPDTLWPALPEITCTPKQFLRSRLHAHTASEASAPFDMLRGRLLRALRSHGWRRVAITAPDPGSGRSTVAANLALSLARQSDLRVLLIEADMRQPALAGMLGLRNPPQFSEALRGAVPLSEPLLRLGDNLCIALNGAPVSDAAELLQRPDLGATLQSLEAMLAPDAVLFDLPAMLSGDDTLGFLDKVDCALLVAAADATTLPDLESCADELGRHTGFLGVVLNKLRQGTAAQDSL